MNKPERLFDCIAYQLEKFPKPDMLAAKEKGVWRKYSTKEVSETVDALACGLMRIGVSGNDLTVENQDKIGIISGNRAEWLMTDLAVQKLGAVLVPIYPTTTIHEIEFIFKEAGVKYVCKQYGPV
jgi:long-chain acyl-CoA synthetase